MMLKNIKFGDILGHVEITLDLSFEEFKEMFKVDMRTVREIIEGKHNDS